VKAVEDVAQPDDIAAEVVIQEPSAGNIATEGR